MGMLLRGVVVGCSIAVAEGLVIGVVEAVAVAVVTLCSRLCLPVLSSS